MFYGSYFFWSHDCYDKCQKFSSDFSTVYRRIFYRIDPARTQCTCCTIVLEIKYKYSLKVLHGGDEDHPYEYLHSCHERSGVGSIPVDIHLKFKRFLIGFTTWSILAVKSCQNNPIPVDDTADFFWGIWPDGRPSGFFHPATSPKKWPKWVRQKKAGQGRQHSAPVEGN